MNKIIIGLTAAALATTSVTLAHADDDAGRFPFLMQGMTTSAATSAPAQAEAPAESAAISRHTRRHAALGYEAGARGSVREIIARHAAANGVPFALADAVVRIESRYNPRVSNGGALGLMQIRPATARGVGFAGSPSALYNAETNVAYGMRYLAQAYRMSRGDVCGTVMRYQSGTYSKHMNAANRVYCSKARAIMAQN
ncbi:MAG: transglycosylase SLT domain-containing protein [Hyphomicrobiales bacterium]|nr:transglycosylase SLT domain-containing protein [Hyphomicrobiales bacterium]